MHKEQTIKVAIADDHTMFREGLIRILSAYKNIEVLFSVENGKDLLKQLGNAVKLPDICIIDINMPVMNGYDTVKRIKKDYATVNCLALSMYGDEENIIRMIRSGAKGYILKGDQPSKLVKALEEVHEKGFFYSELITSSVIKNSKKEDVVQESDFTEKELIFIKYACTDMTYRQIAETMELSERTIDGYRDRLFHKLDTKSRIGLVIQAIRNGLADLY